MNTVSLFLVTFFVLAFTYFVSIFWLLKILILTAVTALLFKLVKAMSSFISI